MNGLISVIVASSTTPPVTLLSNGTTALSVWLVGSISICDFAPSAKCGSKTLSRSAARLGSSITSWSAAVFQRCIGRLERKVHWAYSRLSSARLPCESCVTETHKVPESRASVQ